MSQDAKTADLFADFCRSFWLTRFFASCSGGRSGIMVLLIALFFCIVSAPCFWAAWLDGTLYLAQQNQGVGLMEHPAFWALFIAGPIFTVLILALFKKMALVTDQFCSGSTPEYAPECKEQVLDLLTCRSRKMRIAFGSMMLLGVYAVIANYQNTKTPVLIFGHDVWDSRFHYLGFWTAKVFLAFQWIYLFPLAIYSGMSASLAILLIVNRITSRGSIKIKPFEPDGCGGYRVLGQTMLSVIYLNIPFALFVAADIYTHKTFYITVALSALLVVAILIFEIFAPFVRLHRLLSAGKNQRLQELNMMILSEEGSLRPALAPAPKPETPSLLAVLATVELYKQTQKMHTWPYLPVDRAKWLTPILPFALAILKKIVT